MSKTYLERFTSELGTALTAISFCNVSDLGHRFHHELIEISKVIESSTILWFESPGGPPGPHQAMLGGQDAGHIHRLHSEIVVYLSQVRVVIMVFIFCTLPNF